MVTAAPGARRLRDYQEEAVAAIFEQWEAHDSTLVVVATGCGKCVDVCDGCHGCSLPTSESSSVVMSQSTLRYCYNIDLSADGSARPLVPGRASVPRPKAPQ